MDKVTMLEELMETFNADDLVDCWNEYCYSTNCLDDLIFRTDYIEMWLEEHCSTFMEVFDLNKESFYPGNDWFQETPYGLESFNDWNIADHVSISDMARYVAEYDEFEDFGNADIWALINSEEYSEAA